MIVGDRGGTRASIRGFREGIRAARQGTLASVSRLEVRECERTGLRVRGDGSRVESVEAAGNGGDGVRARGRAVEIEDVTAVGNDGRDVHDATVARRQGARGSRVSRGER